MAKRKIDPERQSLIKQLMATYQPKDVGGIQELLTLKYVLYKNYKIEIEDCQQILLCKYNMHLNNTNDAKPLCILKHCLILKSYISMMGKFNISKKEYN